MTPEVQRLQEVSRQNVLEQAIDNYKQSDLFSSLSRNTRICYNGDLTRFQGYCQNRNTLSINQITREDIINWHDQLKQDNYAPATINRKVASLSTFLGWAGREGLLQTDLTDALVRHTLERRQPKTLISEEIETLIAKAKNLRDASLILISLATGANITEIVNLNREDILRTKDMGTAIRFKGGINKAQPRTLKIDKRAGSLIAEYIKVSKLKPEGPLFKGFKGSQGYRRLTRQGVNLILNKYGHKIGVENLSPRMLRDTFIAKFTGTPRELAEVLGRKT